MIWLLIVWLLGTVIVFIQDDLEFTFEATVFALAWPIWFTALTVMQLVIAALDWLDRLERKIRKR
jgi:hypothetical protein